MGMVDLLLFTYIAFPRENVLTVNLNQLLIEFGSQPNEKRDFGIFQIPVESLRGPYIGLLDNIRFINPTPQAVVHSEVCDALQSLFRLLKKIGEGLLGLLS